MDVVASFDVGGHRVSAQMVGYGPTVVWVAALGEPGANWQPTIERLARTSTNLVYDRSGIGASDPVTILNGRARTATSPTSSHGC